MPPIYGQKLLLTQLDYVSTSYNLETSAKAVLVDGEESPLNSNLFSSISGQVKSTVSSVSLLISNGRLHINSNFTVICNAEIINPYLFIYDETSNKLLLRYKVFDTINTDILNGSFVTFSSTQFPVVVISMQATVCIYHSRFLDIWWKRNYNATAFLAEFSALQYNTVNIPVFPSAGEIWSTSYDDVTKHMVGSPTPSISGQNIALSAFQFASIAYSHTYNAVMLSAYSVSEGRFPCFYFPNSAPVNIAASTVADGPASVLYWGG